MKEVKVRLLADEGWSLQTMDKFNDILAGPFKTQAEAIDAANELGVIIAPSTPVKKQLTVAGLKAGDLFRVDNTWYRCLSKDKENVTADAIAGERNTKLALSTKVTELSVLSKS